MRHNIKWCTGREKQAEEISERDVRTCSDGSPYHIARSRECSRHVDEAPRFGLNRSHGPHCCTRRRSTAQPSGGVSPYHSRRIPIAQLRELSQEKRSYGTCRRLTSDTQGSESPGSVGQILWHKLERTLDRLVVSCHRRDLDTLLRLAE